MDFHCRVNTTIYVHKWNRSNVWKLARKRKNSTSLNFYVYANCHYNCNNKWIKTHQSHWVFIANNAVSSETQGQLVGYDL